MDTGGGNKIVNSEKICIITTAHPVFDRRVFHKQARAYQDVIVQFADDPDFISNVRTVFNNDIDNSAGLGIGSDLHYTETYEGKLIDAKGAKAQYVRLYSAGSSSDDLNHYIEVEVYGKPAK